MRATLKGIARHFPTAIVTGRCRDKIHFLQRKISTKSDMEVYNFVKLAELGMDITGPTKSPKASNNNNKAVLFQSTSQFLPMIDERRTLSKNNFSGVQDLVRKNEDCPRGPKVENNKFCLSLHFRCVDEKSWAALGEKVRLVLNEYPQLRLTQGRKVLEIRPTIKWDKGKALEFLLESLGEVTNAATPSLLVLRSRGQGIGILVSRLAKETNASYSLQCMSNSFL
ncbi:putative trehalose-phosphate phosphatase 6 [Glycine soja]